MIRSACTCVTCKSCGGTGTVWVSFSGKYLGDRRSDDLDESVPCMACDDSGIVEMCDTCHDMRDLEDF